MLKRTIYIGNPSYLRLENNQLKIKCAESNQDKGSIPIEDIGILMLDHAQMTITTQVLEKLMYHSVAVISCDEKHLPNGLMLPLQGHSELTQRWRYQIEASLPLKKQLWKQTVQAKIMNQAALLERQGHKIETMHGYLNQVTSGDETNMEGISAQHYWKYLFEGFKREREGEYPNNFLNFAYAVLRSIVARAIVSSGMMPALGIFHKNKYNPYCLADDIMEPYRPFVDKMVLDWHTSNEICDQLDKKAKAYLLGIATQDLIIDDLKRPLMVAVTTTTASLQACFEGKKRQISYQEPALTELCGY
jgi:CRISP-associated protein Cas1